MREKEKYSAKVRERYYKTKRKTDIKTYMTFSYIPKKDRHITFVCSYVFKLPPIKIVPV